MGDSVPEVVAQLHYHIVFSTKYRKPALRGTIGEQVRELIREICKGLEIDILISMSAMSEGNAARSERVR